MQSIGRRRGREGMMMCCGRCGRGRGGKWRFLNFRGMEVWEIEVGRRERLARGTGGMSMVAMVYRCWKERAT